MALGRGPFKYMRREHALGLVRQGIIRIGTAYEFLRTDLHGEEIGDRSEGAAYFEIQRDEFEAVANDTSEAGLSAWVRDMLRNAAGVNNFQTFVAIFHDNDAWMYCVAMSYDAQAMESFGYDACIEIVDPAGFLSAITAALAPMGDYVGTGACQYRGRAFSYWDARIGFAPYLLKDPRHAYQSEARALWLPTKDWLIEQGRWFDRSRLHPAEDDRPPYTLDPLILEIPALKDCVRLV